MKAKADMRHFDLDRALRAIRADEPPLEAIAASRARLQKCLFASEDDAQTQNTPILGCQGVEALLVAYRRGTLSAGRALLIRSHLAECASCRKVYARRGKLRLAPTPWERSTRSSTAPTPRARRTFAVLAAAMTLCIGIWLLRLALPSDYGGQLATVQAVSGMLYRIDGASASRLTPGATLRKGERVRAGDAPRSLVRLMDGSTIELGERAEFSIESRASDTTLQLQRGQVIVKAAKRDAGRLYVATRDCRVAVAGTVFSVMTDLKGSRVSVIEGKVQVTEKSGPKSALNRGEQLTTSPFLGRVPIEQEIAWSRDLDEHLALLHEITEVGKQLRQLRSPAMRFESELLAWAPEDAFLYAALPNYGDALTEGYRLFRTKLGGSPVLQRWWQASQVGERSDRLDAWFSGIREFSSYLGDELVITVSRRGDEDEVLALAEVKKPGIRERIGSELMLPGGGLTPLMVLDEHDLATGRVTEFGSTGATLLVTQKLVALSSSPRALTELAARLSVEDRSPFLATALGQRVASAYEKGVDLLVAADLEFFRDVTSGEPSNELERSLRAVEFEHKEVMGQSVNSGVLTFTQPGRGIASWLATPAPMGSLDFVTPRASAVAAFIVRQPVTMLAEVLRHVPNSKNALVAVPELEGTLDPGILEAMREALGSELAIALDGPMLPVPAWKLVTEVQDPERLERALESWAVRVDRLLRSRNSGSLSLEHERMGERTGHCFRWVGGTLPLEVHYAFVDGYLVATPTRALLTRGIEARTSGTSLASSSRFTSVLPRDGRAVFSGFVFQDLMSGLASAVDEAGPDPRTGQRRSVDGLLRESKPKLVAFYAGPDRIEMAGTGELLDFGPEALALPDIIRHILSGTSATGRPR